MAVLCGGSLHAQSAYFVDPVLGSDAATGLAGDPWRTVSHANLIVAAGDTLWLGDGTYAASGFGGQETYPLILQDGVRYRALPGATPVFDPGDPGPGANDAVGVQTMTAPTLLEGVTITDSGTALGNASGASVFGLEVRGCTFTGFSTGGVVLLVENGGGSQSLLIEDCTFAGSAAARAVSIRVANGTTLLAGGIRGCTVTGGVDEGLVVSVRDTATVVADFTIANNDVAGFDLSGIAVLATGSGGSAANLATNDASVAGNTVTGAGLGVGTEVGVLLSAAVGAGSEGARVRSTVRFNDVTGCAAAASCRSANNSAARADVEAAFFGNRLRSSTLGAEVLNQAPNPVNPNATPDFGSTGSGANTFAGNGGDLFSTLNTPALDAQRNFFPAGSATVSQGTWDTSDVLSETLAGTFDGNADSQAASTVVLTAAALVAFVDNSDAAGAEQLAVTVDGNALPQPSISAPIPGTALTLLIPALGQGSFDVVLTNPGGQTGTLQLTASPGGGGGGGGDDGGGGGCFVATAAHGDYGSAEVLELRRLRDQYLQATPGGRAFIRWYYAEGPAAAAWIAERPWARGAARAALAAPVAVSHALTTWNSGQRFGFAVLLLGVALGALQRQRRDADRRAVARRAALVEREAQP